MFKNKTKRTFTNQKLLQQTSRYQLDQENTPKLYPVLNEKEKTVQQINETRELIMNWNDPHKLIDRLRGLVGANGAPKRYSVN